MARNNYQYEKRQKEIAKKKKKEEKRQKKLNKLAGIEDPADVRYDEEGNVIVVVADTDVDAGLINSEDTESKAVDTGGEIPAEEPVDE